MDYIYIYMHTLIGRFFFRKMIPMLPNFFFPIERQTILEVVCVCGPPAWFFFFVFVPLSFDRTSCISFFSSLVPYINLFTSFVIYPHLLLYSPLPVHTYLSYCFLVFGSCMRLLRLIKLKRTL